MLSSFQSAVIIIVSVVAVVLAKMWRLLATATIRPRWGTASITSSAMSTLAERRNMREQQRTNQLPGLLWLLLVLGAVATILSSCVLGNDQKWLHYCQVGALTFVVVTAWGYRRSSPALRRCHCCRAVGVYSGA